MIESEERRQRITERITRWCGHTKILPHLREYDIPGLVGFILEEFYHVKLSCGHLVRDMNEGIVLTFKETDGSEVTGIYCKDCVKRYKKDLNAWEPNERS